MTDVLGVSLSTSSIARAGSGTLDDRSFLAGEALVRAGRRQDGDDTVLSFVTRRGTLASA